MAVLLKDDARKFFCTLYFTMNGLFESIDRYILEVLKYASISFMLPEKQDTGPATQVEIPRDIADYQTHFERRTLWR